MNKTRIHLKELPSLGSGPVMEEALRVIRGVRDVTVEPDARRVTVLHDDDVSGHELLQAVCATGVAAELIPQSRADDAS